MQKGFLMFAYNNDVVDYAKLAICCAKLIKKHLKENSVTLITDAKTYKHIRDNYEEKSLENIFYKIILVKNEGENPRKYFQGDDAVSANFKNLTRVDAYDLTPYEETVVIDTDYLVFDNMLDKVWGTSYDICMNKELRLLHDTDEVWIERMLLKRLSDTSIPLYWATLVYFKKNEISRKFFELVKYFKENYYYYKMLYGYPINIYRNDYTFSMAAHMMNNHTTSDYVVGQFPVSRLIFLLPDERILKYEDGNFICRIFPKHSKSDIKLVNLKDTSFHCMNKQALLHFVDAITEDVNK